MYYLTLNQNNREIILEEVYACRTYAGLLEGLPNEELNERLVDELKEYKNKVRQSDTWPFHQIVPADLSRDLPELYLVGLFNSGPLMGSDECGSHLIIGWFQDEMWPIDDSDFEFLDWENLAKGWDP